MFIAGAHLVTRLTRSDEAATRKAIVERAGAASEGAPASIVRLGGTPMQHSVVENGQVEIPQPRWIGEQVDLDDPAVRDREAGHRDRPSARSHDDESRGPVDERRPREGGKPRGATTNLLDH